MEDKETQILTGMDSSLVLTMPKTTLTHQELLKVPQSQMTPHIQ